MKISVSDIAQFFQFAFLGPEESAIEVFQLKNGPVIIKWNVC